MRISFIRVIFIIIFAIVLALLINYLQPNSLPLIKDDNGLALNDQSIQKPDLDTTALLTNKQKEDRNKIAVENNKAKINDEITPEYDFSNDSDTSNNSGNLKGNMPSQKDDDVNLNNLTKDVFNQPRLISLPQAYELYREKILFIDARNIEQFEEGHIAGAINLPYFSIDEFINKLDGIDKTEPVVTYCEGVDCDMSIRLGNELFSRGFKKVFVFFGGWEEWSKSGYPVVTSDTEIRLN